MVVLRGLRRGGHGSSGCGLRWRAPTRCEIPFADAHVHAWGAPPPRRDPHAAAPYLHRALPPPTTTGAPRRCRRAPSQSRLRSEEGGDVYRELECNGRHDDSY